jgi:hypothetical protein
MKALTDRSRRRDRASTGAGLHVMFTRDAISLAHAYIWVFPVVRSGPMFAAWLDYPRHVFNASVG